MHSNAVFYYWRINIIYYCHIVIINTVLCHFTGTMSSFCTSWHIIPMYYLIHHHHHHHHHSHGDTFIFLHGVPSLCTETLSLENLCILSHVARKEMNACYDNIALLFLLLTTSHLSCQNFWFTELFCNSFKFSPALSLTRLAQCLGPVWCNTVWCMKFFCLVKLVCLVYCTECIVQSLCIAWN